MLLNSSSIIKFILICIFSIGFYAGADQKPVPEATVDKTTVTAPEVKTDMATLKVPEIKMDKPERNGFASLYLNSSYDTADFIMNISTGYGVVLGKSAIADAGVLEGRVGVSGGLPGNGWSLGFNTTAEINFIKNDGVNTLIPGLMLGANFGYRENWVMFFYPNPSPETDYKEGDLMSWGFNLDVYLKAFVSKQFAVIPYLGLSYNNYSANYINRNHHNQNISSEVLALTVGVGLRQYF